MNTRQLLYQLSHTPSSIILVMIPQTLPLLCAPLNSLLQLQDSRQALLQILAQESPPPQVTFLNSPPPGKLSLPIKREQFPCRLPLT